MGIALRRRLLTGGEGHRAAVEARRRHEKWPRHVRWRHRRVRRRRDGRGGRMARRTARCKGRGARLWYSSPRLVPGVKFCSPLSSVVSSGARGVLKTGQGQLLQRFIIIDDVRAQRSRQFTHMFDLIAPQPAWSHQAATPAPPPPRWWKKHSKRSPQHSSISHVNLVQPTSRVPQTLR
jgi:hypothetical protein